MQPEELGVFTVTMSVAVILSTLQAAGSSEILLYSKEVTSELQRRVLGLTLVTTAIVCAVLVLGRPIWIALFGSPGVADVADIIAVQTAIGAFATPVLAMWRREEAFDRLSLVNIISGATLSVLQVAFVFAGHSYLGLAYAALASTVMTLALSATLGRAHLILKPNFRQLGRVAVYGSKMFGANALGQIYSQSTSAIIGAMGGVAQSALFGRAFMISQIYSQTIGKAVDPILNSRLASERRSGSDGNVVLFLYSRYLLTLAAMFFGFIAICSDLIIPLIFGPQWSAAVPAMQILTAGLVLIPLTSPTAGVLLAADRPGMLIRVRFVNVVLRITALVLLAPISLTAVAWGMVGTAYFNWLQSIHAAHKVADLPIRDYLRMLLPSLIVALIPLALALSARFGLTALGISGWGLLVGTGAAMAGLSLASLAIAKHPIWEELLLLARRGSKR